MRNRIYRTCGEDLVAEKELVSHFNTAITALYWVAANTKYDIISDVERIISELEDIIEPIIGQNIDLAVLENMLNKQIEEDKQ